MALWSLIVTDADDKVFNFCQPGKEGQMPVDAGKTLYTNVELGSTVPEVDDTYDGVTYTPAPKPDYFDVEDPQDSPLANGATVSIPADNSTTKQLFIQKKKGSDDTDMVGTGEVVKALPTAIIKIDKMDVVLDATDGMDSVTIGPFPTDQRGCCELRFTNPDLGTRVLILEVTD